MTSPIGNNKGFTFIEVMVTLVIFSTGIVAVFQSYLISLDRINHITNRLYAGIYLDERLRTIERNLKVYQTLPFELDRTKEVDVGGKTLTYKHDLKISQVENFNDVFQLDLSYEWEENNRTVSLSRSIYISDFQLAE